MANIEHIPWVRIKSIAAASMIAPTLAGVYAYGIVEREVAGLPVGTYSWAYVGRSDNLARRFSDHDVIRERDPALRQWLADNRERAEVWYASMQAGQTKAIEKHLIRELQPLCNRRRYTDGGEK